MNTLSIVEKMEKIQNEFAQALQAMPVAQNADQVIEIVFEGHHGLKINGIFVWGVTKQEYLQYYNL